MMDIGHRRGSEGVFASLPRARARADLLEKVINCRYILDHWMPGIEKMSDGPVLYLHR